MREYRYQATDATIEALRRLKAPWAAAHHAADVLLVTTHGEGAIRITAERADVEASLEAIRLRADIVDDAAPSPGGATLDVLDLGVGRNDVVLFTGETWAEDHPAAGDDGAAAVQTMQFHGRAGQRPATAAVVCTTTDAIVVASPSGEGILVRPGVKPLSIDVETDRVAIARFLVQRGYTAE